MIKIIDGDLFDTDTKFICHQVNCMGKMRSGVALQVREKFPHVYEEYKKAASPKMLGKVQVVPVDPSLVGYPFRSIPQEKQLICNLFAQNKYGYDGKQYTDINALLECFGVVAWIAQNFIANGKIAMPYKIGCARGGADWDEVYKIIEHVFSNCEVELWRCDKG